MTNTFNITGFQERATPRLSSRCGVPAGAEPDAGRRTVLMVVGWGTATILLDQGADPKLFDLGGDTALHLVRDAGTRLRGNPYFDGEA